MENLAKEINNRLDDLILLYKEYRKVEKTKNKKNISEAMEIIELVHEDINKITNNGKNIRDIFTNQFYINDAMQDRLLASQIEN